MLEVRNVSKSFGDRRVLDDISLTIGENEYLTMLGPSGSGKSVLLRTIAGFERPDSGDILLNGRSVAETPVYRRNIGYVFQGFALFPHFSVFDNVAYGLRHRQADPVTDEREVDRRVREALDLVGLDDLTDRRIDQISGGQKQRVALARTLASQPSVCLLDEPLGALDANLRERMRAELRHIRKSLGITFIHLTGNEHEALAIGDRVAVMRDGRLEQVDRPAVVYGRPATSYVARLLDSYNIFPGAVAAGRFECRDFSAPLPPGNPPDGPARYCVRYDTVSVSEGGTDAGEGRASVAGRFIAEEYSGSGFLYTFALAQGSMLEVEWQLSLHEPLRLSEGADYRLSWEPSAALLYPE